MAEEREKGGVGRRRELEPCGSLHRTGSLRKWEDWDTRVPSWLGMGPALHIVMPRPEAAGCQRSSFKTPGEPEIKYSSTLAQTALLPLTANVLL